MKIQEQKIRSLILEIYRQRDREIDPSRGLEAFLKRDDEGNRYVKLYADGAHKLVLSEKYKQEKEFAELADWLADNEVQEKGLRDYTLADLHALPEGVKDEMRSIWFSADQHHGHKSMAANKWDDINRPTTKDEHDQWLVDQINSRVKRKDKLYLIGDVSLATRKEAEKFLHKLNGHKTLIYGNHDKNIKNTHVISEKTWIKDFTFSRPGIDIAIALCHYPMVTWNRKVHGAWHLYGHVHGRYEHPDLAMDVGIDHPRMNFLPINLYEVAEYMLDKKDRVTFERDVP